MTTGSVGPRRRAASIRTAASVTALLVAMGALAGCSTWWQRTFSAREIVTQGLNENAASLPFSFPYAWYENQPAQTSLYLSDLSPEELSGGGELTGQVAHVQVLWLPRPGWTPSRPGSTNVVIRLLVFSRGEIGLYGGGGFAWPWDEPGDPTFGMEVLGSSLTLLEKTEGFVDLLSPAELTGAFDAPLDDGGAQRMRMITSQLVTNAFKSVRWVRIWNGAEDSRADAHSSRRDLAAAGEFGREHGIDRFPLRIIAAEETHRCAEIEVDHDEHRVLQIEGAGPPAVGEIARER